MQNEKIVDVVEAVECCSEESDKPPSSMPIGPITHGFMEQNYPSVPYVEWNDWRWQLRNRIIDTTDNNYKFPMGITPYYASILGDKLRKTVMPSDEEHIISQCEQDDPLHEINQSPVDGLVHRYPDRVLFLVTDYCSTICRYCTRSRMVGKDKTYTKEQWMKSLKYIEEHKEIRDVLISGGDPLTLPTETLEWILSNLRKIPHVEMIRIGTKIPAVLPQRITKELTDMLKQYHPLFMSLHFTHPSELTPETQEACNRLADAGIPLGSQTVLLKDVNDDSETLKKLFTGLLKIRVKPYYTYICDKVTGSGHFRTTIEKGIEIFKSIRGNISGYAIPQLVVDLPAGGGKIPIIYNYIKSVEGVNVVIENYKGELTDYYNG
jgi:lysine 2,3-aminomutase